MTNTTTKATTADRMYALSIGLRGDQLDYDFSIAIEMAIEVESDEYDVTLADCILTEIAKVAEEKGGRLRLSDAMFADKFSVIDRLLNGRMAIQGADMSTKPDVAQTNYYNVGWGGRLYARRHIQWSNKAPKKGAAFKRFYDDNYFTLGEYYEMVPGWTIDYVSAEQIESLIS